MFVYSEDGKSSYKCLSEYGGTFTELFMITIQGWHKLKNSQYLQDIYFVFNSESDFAHISTQGHWLIAVWTCVAETRVPW